MCMQEPCAAPEACKAPLLAAVSALGMLSDLFLPTAEPLAHPMLETVRGYSKLWQLSYCTPHTCFPTTCTTLL